MRRLRGLFIIARALLPIIVAVGLIGATWLTSRILVEATSQYGDDLGAQLDGIQAAVDEANEGLAAIGGFVTSTVEAADTLVERVSDLRSSVDIPLPDIEVPEFRVLDRIIDLPDLRLGDGFLEIPIPGVEALQGIATDLAEAGRLVSDPLVKVTALAQVPPQLEEAARSTAVYAGDIRSALRWWLIGTALILLGGAIIWALAALRPIASELSRGWALLSGKPSADRAIGNLAARVAALERKLS